jgi:hypothetical protein
MMLWNSMMLALSNRLFTPNTHKQQGRHPHKDQQEQDKEQEQEQLHVLILSRIEPQIEEAGKEAGSTQAHTAAPLTSLSSPPISHIAKG